MTKTEIVKIRDLRTKGYSMPEISSALKIPKTTVFRYIRNVQISPQYKNTWFGKRGGSRKRMLLRQRKAFEEAKKLVGRLSYKEKLLFLSALYWAEGNKRDLILTNTDPNLIKVFVSGGREVLGISDERVQISIRLYEDIDRDQALSFWSEVVGIPKEKFLSVYVLSGKKNGKLQYGMCRIRIIKGGDILKKINGVNKAVVAEFAPVAQRIE